MKYCINSKQVQKNSYTYIYFNVEKTRIERPVRFTKLQSKKVLTVLIDSLYVYINVYIYNIASPHLENHLYILEIY